MKIRKSAEDYLEAMLVLQEEHGYIRSIDIAKKPGVTKPSVSYAVKRLRESGPFPLFLSLAWLPPAAPAAAVPWPRPP